MTPADLSRTVLHAVRRAVDENALRAPVPARVRVERTRPGGSGDYACAVALQLAGPAGLPALEVARILRERVAAEPGVRRVEITGPGFLSFTLDAPAAGDRAVLDAVREQGIAYGHGDALRDEEIRLPYAPEVRAAVTADAVRRLLAAQGARVRIICEGVGDPEWGRLGVTATADAHGTPAAPHTPLASPGPLTANAHGTPPAPAPYSPLASPVTAATADAHGTPPVTHTPSASSGPLTADAQGTPAAPHTPLASPGPLTADAHGTPPAPAPHTPLAPSAPLTPLRPVPAGATAAELLERLGSDAARWGLLRLASHDRAPLGDDLLVQGEANLFFRVRYAHARARALTRNAAALGFTSTTGAVPYGSPARPLLDLLADHPGVLLAAARHRAPDRVARQLEAVAHAFFDFHDSCPPLPSGDEKPSAAHRSRLALAEAAGTVLAGGLSLLGIRAPAHL
ncbi:arginine--tRNA ligase [Streptomyces sp. SID8374]|uniref:ArgS-related anticodon-binding protein NrtL n=1 Tax=Streptomyces sp. SID8374 TaxID=2690354 RepID=UPI00136F505F|nr:arginine--tRNA ligase [Streptomyces sp. SID8374]